MGFELLLAFPAVKKVIDLVRYIAEGGTTQWRESLIVVASWVAGFGMAALVAASSYAGELGLAGATVPDLALVGVVIGSAAGVGVDFFNGGVTVR